MDISGSDEPSHPSIPKTGNLETSADSDNERLLKLNPTSSGEIRVTFKGSEELEAEFFGKQDALDEAMEKEKSNILIQSVSTAFLFIELVTN